MKSVNKIIKIKGLPEDDRIWRIDWFDGIARNPIVESDSTVEVIYTPVVKKTGSILDDWATDWTKQNKTIRSFPVSYLNRISIGSTWKNGELVGTLNYRKDRSLRIYLPPQNGEPQFKTIGEEARDRVKWNYEPFSNTYCLVLENCKYSFMGQYFIGKIIIPCPELVRFYFATSTKLVRKIIHFNGDELRNELILEKDSTGKIRTGLSGSELLLTLKTVIPNSDAWAIARLLTDKTAEREVNRLYRSMSGEALMSNKESLFNMKMGFPFSGASTLNVYGKISEDHQFILILNIETCDADFPFSKLRLDRENSNLVKKKYAFAREVGYPHLKVPNTDNSEPATLSNHSEPTKKVTRRTIKINRKRPRFLKIEKKAYERVIREEQKYRASYNKITPIQAVTYGTGEGSYTSDETHLPLDIVEDFPKKNNIDITGVKHPDKTGNSNNARPYFAELIQAMSELHELHDTYEFDWNVISLPKGTKDKEIQMSTFPEPNPSEGLGSNWLNISKSQKRKILWLEVSRKNKYTYIAELDCRPTEHFAIYLLTYQGGRNASVSEINQVMQLWASDQKYCAPNGLREHGKLSWDKRILSHKDPEKLAKKIWGRL